MEHVCLPISTVESIFARLELTYGAPWIAKWKGLNKRTVYEHWSQELGGLHDWQIDFALQNLPDNAPSLAAFKRLAESATGGSAKVPAGMEWVWVPLPLDGCPETGQPTRKASLMPIGSGFDPIRGDAERPPEANAEQRARIHALCAASYERMGDTRRADRARGEAAIALEEARDALRARGESTSHLSSIVRDAEVELVQVRERRIAAEVEKHPAVHADGNPFQFDLAGLLRRQGTPAEQPRDLARLIAARHERGVNVGSFARSKAKEALRGREREDWLTRRGGVAPISIAAPAAKVAPVQVTAMNDAPWDVMPWDAAEVLPL